MMKRMERIRSNYNCGQYCFTDHSKCFEFRLIYFISIKLKRDTAGQERFRALTTAYYRGAMAIIVVFDVTNLESFQHIQYWFKNIDEVRLIL